MIVCNKQGDAGKEADSTTQSASAAQTAADSQVPAGSDGTADVSIKIIPSADSNQKTESDSMIKADCEVNYDSWPASSTEKVEEDKGRNKLINVSTLDDSFGQGEGEKKEDDLDSNHILEEETYYSKGKQKVKTKVVRLRDYDIKQPDYATNGTLIYHVDRLTMLHSDELRYEYI